MHFWTSAETINQTHLNDFGRISEYKMYDEAKAHRFLWKVMRWHVIFNYRPGKIIRVANPENLEKEWIGSQKKL